MRRVVGGMWHQLVRFGVVGMAATLVHVVVAFLCYRFSTIDPTSANLAGFLSAVAVSYLGNFRWTFGLSGNHGQHLARFAVSSLLCLVVSHAITVLTHGLLGMPYPVALIAIVMTVPPLSFALAKLWTFVPRQ